MSTFSNTYGAEPMLASVAEHLKDIEMPDTGDIDIHTITLVLNGQHGEFDLVVEATESEGYMVVEEHRWEGIAYRSGGVSDFKEVEVR